MMKKKLFLLILFSIAAGFAVWLVNSYVNREQEAGEELLPLPLLNYHLYDIERLIADTNNQTLQEGNFNTQGAVIGKFPCQRCPAGAECIPCKGDFLVVAPDKEIKQPTNNKILINVEPQKRLDDFNIGSYYIFSVSIDPVLEMIDLKGYERSEEINLSTKKENIKAEGKTASHETVSETKSQESPVRETTVQETPSQEILTQEIIPQGTPAVNPQNFTSKGYWFYSLIYSDQSFLISTPSDLKSSGANLASISIPTKIDGSGNVAYELGVLSTKQALLGRIETLAKRYHEAGLKVMLVMELTQVSNLNETAGDPAPFTPGLNLNNFDSLVLEVAEIAQKNGVEYFSPLNEPDRKLGSAYISFCSNILPKVKNIFSGKVVLKGDNPGTNVAGYDVLGISLSPENTNVASYRNLVKQRMANLQQMKLGEIWITEFGNWANVSSFSESQKAESHRIVLEEALGKVSGVIVYEPSVRDSWQIKGTQVYDVIKEFYEK